jgi:MFS family permease
MSMFQDVRALPAVTRRLLLLGALNNLGTGLIMPFMVIYVHDVHHLPVAVATTAVAVTSIGVVLGAPLAGWLADRRGPELTAVLYLVVQALGITGYAFAGTSWAFVGAALVVGLGGGGGAAWSSMYAASTPPAAHPVVVTDNLAGVNVASGVGALIGAAIASVSHPGTFRVLYLADAASCALVAVGVAVGVRVRAAARPPGETAATPPGSYGVVLRDRVFLLTLALGGGLFCVSYAQLESGFPVYATTHGTATAAQLGVLFAVNTACVVGAQFLLHDLFKRLRNVRAVAIAAGLWALCWLLTAAAGSLDAGPSRFGLLLAAIGVFAVGETFFAAGMPALVNALAPAAARGRYNASYSTVVSIGFVVGPLAAGAWAAGASGTAFVVLLAVLCAAAGAGFLRLRLPVTETGTERETPVRDEVRPLQEIDGERA